MTVPPHKLFVGYVPGVTKTTVVSGKEDINDDRKPRLRRLLSVPSLLSSRRSTRMATVVNDPPRARKQDPDCLAIRPADSTRFTPILPPELWIQILRIAAGCTTHHRSSSPVSFLDHPTPHAQLASRLHRYRENIKFRSSLTKVCRAWNLIGQEILYEFIWLSKASEGRWLAGRLCGDLGLPAITSVVSVASSPKSSRKASKGPVSSNKQPTSNGPSVLQRMKGARPLGHYIRRLHVETLTMDRCSPHDMLLILQHCPFLTVFADHRSIRRPMHPLIFSSSNVVAPFSSGIATPTNPHHAPMNSSAVISTLLSGPSQLTHLSYTHYSYDPADFDGEVNFYMGVIAPGLEQVGERVQFLEVSLNSASTGMHGDGQGDAAWSIAPSAAGQEQAPSAPFSRPLSSTPRLNANWLTELRGDFTSTSISCIDSAPASTSTSFSPPPLVLPSLRTLKATLDNATFYVLSTWSMPRLCNLSIISADFSYAGRGFQQFFEVHGHKVIQLELGHSSADIEEYWLTEPPPRARNDVTTLTTLATSSASIGVGGISAPFGTPGAPSHSATYPIPPLAAWTPNLKEFICSADAEWNWQSPDWISPHVLLPSHPGVELIAVKDIDARLLDDLEMWERRKWEHTQGGYGFMGNGRTGAEAGAGQEQNQDDPFFVLLEQFSSLFRKVSFPSLRYVRDLSQASHEMRSAKTATTSGTSNARSPHGRYPGDLDTPDLSAEPSARGGPTVQSGTTPAGTVAAAVKARASTNGLRNLFSSSTPSSSSTTTPPSSFASGTTLISNINGSATTATTTSNMTIASLASAARFSPFANSPFARSLSPSSPSDLPSHVRRDLVHRFWRAVLFKCRERGVWLEDWRGQTLTFGDILRAEAGCK